MRNCLTSIALTAILLLPAAAGAQMSDSAYCSAMADKYQRYTSDNSISRNPQRNATVDTAISQCGSKPADSIPVLEKALKDARLDLPKR